MTKKQAFAYLRVSGRGQVNRDGFPRQREAVKKYAAANGVQIEREFLEKGVSGALDLAHRPAFLEMMTTLHANGTKLVLVEKLDRLARDLMVQEHIIADLRTNGFEILSVMEPDLCIDDPSRKLMRQIMGAIAEYDKTMIVLKLRVARQRKRKEKPDERSVGRHFFGHHPRRPDEAVTLKRMIELKASGLCPLAIARLLNGEGRETRLGKPWHSAVIQSILSRERETGMT
jgi:DNA invertase Pin-like site-specific DNA recombinase